MEQKKKRIINFSTVKDFANTKLCSSVSFEVRDTLEEEIRILIARAIKRMRLNGRKTLQAKDL